MLGVAAIAEDSGDELKWDAKVGRFTNKESANMFLKHRYRKGWEILASGCVIRRKNGQQ